MRWISQIRPGSGLIDQKKTRSARYWAGSVPRDTDRRFCTRGYTLGLRLAQHTQAVHVAPVGGHYPPNGRRCASLRRLSSKAIVCTVAVRQQPLQAMLAGALVDG